MKFTVLNYVTTNYLVQDFVHSISLVHLAKSPTNELRHGELVCRIHF